MTLSQEQLEWLQSKLDFGTLAEMLKAARDKFPDTDIVPTILLAGRPGSFPGWRRADDAEADAQRA